MIRSIVCFVLITIQCFNAKAQTVEWHNLFEIHSINSLGGLSKNSVVDSEGNILIAVVEMDILKLYKFDNQGNIISSFNTNQECGYFSQIIQVSTNNFALVYDANPDEISAAFRLLEFNNMLNSTTETILNFPGINPLKISNFFINDDVFYFSIINNNFQGIYSINDLNLIELKYSSTLPTAYEDSFSFLQNGNVIVDYKTGNNQLIRCISLISGLSIWEKSYNTENIDVIQLDYKVTLNGNENLIMAGLERTWTSGLNTDVIKLKKIDSTTGIDINSSSFTPDGSCIQIFENVKINPNNDHLYICYRTCFPNQNVVVSELDENFNFINQISIPHQYDELESTAMGANILFNNDGSIILVFTNYKNSTENGNLFVAKLNSNLNIIGITDFNIEPKNSSEAFSNCQLYGTSQILVTGVVPNTNPLIMFEEVQHYLALFELNNNLANNNFSSNVNIISPNPVKNTLTINSEKEITAVHIYDVSGKNLISSVGFNKNIDVSILNEGTYILKVLFDDKKSESFKFIKY